MKKTFRNALMILSVLALIGVVFSFSSCKKDSTTTPPVIVLDGYYVTGAATAYTALDAKALMTVTRNEVTQTERASLLELYIPLKATGGFNIVKVAGAAKTTYGPGADFGIATGLITDEPKVPFQRGTLAVTATTFTVPTDGMYHVVIDYDLNKVVICPVHWGMIGAALTLGWGTSTDMTESAFNATTMSWTISDLKLTGGDWKFRYSNGWKIVLDTALDLGGGNKGVRVNTNFGGATVSALVPGGANFVNAAPGIYTVLFSYTLGSGYTATLTKTGDLPLTNWTGVQCDAIGQGVSIENPTANTDTSSWHWGRQMLADNGGIPTVATNLYTWEWADIILEADSGFKVRTVNGVAPPVGGANFDAGFAALDVANSAAEIVDDGGNLKATLKAHYKIILTIDAANNDTKKIVITKL